MRARSNHSFSDRLIRADINSLDDEYLIIAICADSPNSSDITCETRGINGSLKKRIGAVAQIIRDYPEFIIKNRNDIPEIKRIMDLIFNLQPELISNVLRRLQNNHKNNFFARPPGG